MWTFSDSNARFMSYSTALNRPAQDQEGNPSRRLFSPLSPATVSHISPKYMYFVGKPLENSVPNLRPRSDIKPANARRMSLGSVSSLLLYCLTNSPYCAKGSRSYSSEPPDVIKLTQVSARLSFSNNSTSRLTGKPGAHCCPAEYPYDLTKDISRR